MSARTREIAKNKRDLLNRIAGRVTIALGLVLTVFRLGNFNTEYSLFYPVISLLSSIALIFLGIYVLRFEKWAIVLTGVYGCAEILHSLWLSGLFSGFYGTVFNLVYILLIVNWMVFKPNDKQ